MLPAEISISPNCFFSKKFYSTQNHRSSTFLDHYCLDYCLPRCTEKTHGYQQKNALAQFDIFLKNFYLLGNGIFSPKSSFFDFLEHYCILRSTEKTLGYQQKKNALSQIDFFSKSFFCSTKVYLTQNHHSLSFV